MKRVADGSESVVGVPPVLKPVKVDVAVDDIAIEIDHIAVTVRVVPDRTNIQSTISATAH